MAAANVLSVRADRQARARHGPAGPAVNPDLSHSPRGADLCNVAATYDPETGDAMILAVDRAETDPLHLAVDLKAFGEFELVEHVYLGGTGLTDTNVENEPERVTPAQGHGVSIERSLLTTDLPPISWNMFRLAPSVRPAARTTD